MYINSPSKPVLYFSYSTLNEENRFYLSAKRYEANSDEWEKNNIELDAVWFKSREATFQVLSNILFQAGIVLVRG